MQNVFFEFLNLSFFTPGFPCLWLNIEAAKQIQLGDFDTALWLLHSVDALTAQRAGERAAHHRRTMLNNFGCLEQRRGRPEAAYGYMSQAIALGCTDNPHVLLNAVAVLEKLDQHPEVAVGYSRCACGSRPDW